MSLPLSTDYTKGNMAIQHNHFKFDHIASGSKGKCYLGCVFIIYWK